MDELAKLIAMLKANGVAYYKDSECEIIFAPGQSAPAVTAAPDVRPELPKAFDKLNPNYSHPSLLNMVKIG